MDKLHEYAQKVFEEHRTDDAAVAKMMEFILADEALVRRAVRVCADDALGRAKHTARIVISAPQRGSVNVYAKEFQRSVQITSGRYINWPMMDGSRMADASREHLFRDAMTYLKTKKGIERNMRFLVHVGSQLKPGEKVSARFSDETLAEQYARAVSGSMSDDDVIATVHNVIREIGEAA